MITDCHNVNFPWKFPSKRTYTEVFQDFPWKVPRNLSGQSWAHPLVNYSLELQRLVRNQQNPIRSQVSCLILVIKCTILVNISKLSSSYSKYPCICWVCWVSQSVYVLVPQPDIHCNDCIPTGMTNDIQLILPSGKLTVCY